MQWQRVAICFLLSFALKCCHNLGRLDVEDSAFSTVEQLGEVVGAEEDLLSLEMVTLATRHTDLTEDQLACLLIFRCLKHHKTFRFSHKQKKNT